MNDDIIYIFVFVLTFIGSMWAIMQLTFASVVFGIVGCIASAVCLTYSVKNIIDT